MPVPLDRLVGFGSGTPGECGQQPVVGVQPGAQLRGGADDAEQVGVAIGQRLPERLRLPVGHAIGQHVQPGNRNSSRPRSEPGKEVKAVAGPATAWRCSGGRAETARTRTPASADDLARKLEPPLRCGHVLAVVLGQLTDGIVVPLPPPQPLVADGQDVGQGVAQSHLDVPEDCPQRTGDRRIPRVELDGRRRGFPPMARTSVASRGADR
jgi:hypothetical protein